MESTVNGGLEHQEAVWSLSTSSPNLILSGSLDGTVKSWILAEEGEIQLAHSFDTCHSLGVTSVDLHRSGQFGISSSLDNSLAFFDLSQNKVAKKITLASGTGFKICLSPDGTHFATAGLLGRIFLYSVDSGELISTIDTLSEQFIMSLAYSPDGEFIACGTNQGLVFTLELKTLSICRKFTVHNKPIRAVAYSTSGTKLAVGCDDGRITVYDPVHQSVLGSLIGHTSWVSTMKIVKEDIGEILISGSCDTTTRFWNLSTMVGLGSVKAGINKTSLPYQIWGLGHFERPGRLSKIIVGLESGLLYGFDQPFFKSK